MIVTELLDKAKAAKKDVFALSSDEKNAAIYEMASCLEENAEKILKANEIDCENAKEHIGEVMLDRLRLTNDRIKAMADGMRKVAQLDDPCGRVLEKTERPNGLTVEKTAVPIGVVAIIYESRPNVTSDAAVLSFKSGNVCVLRGGKEAYSSAKAIVSALKEGLKRCNINENAINLVSDTTRESATALMTASGKIDLLIPRGGKGLIDACVKNATVPCIQTGTGICHIYVDKYANLDMAVDIIENAKKSRPSVCNACEAVLVHKDVADEFLPKLKKRITETEINPVELRTDERAYKIIGGTRASENDFDTEFLDYVLAVAVVDSLDGAIEHIALHSTGHSEAIITEDERSAAMFTGSVDSAAVYVNASTRFTDGGEFGLGCEMGISTQKMHARGPMGLKELTTYKYIVKGNGQIR